MAKIGLIPLNKLITLENVADLLTKQVPRAVLDKLAGMMSYTFPGKETQNFRSTRTSIRITGIRELLQLRDCWCSTMERTNRWRMMFTTLWTKCLISLSFVESSWRTKTLLMRQWCITWEEPSAVNVNLYRDPQSQVRRHSDDEPLFSSIWESKLVVFLGLGAGALFRWKPCRSRSLRAEDGLLPSHGDPLGLGWVSTR